MDATIQHWWVLPKMKRMKRIYLILLLCSVYLTKVYAQVVINEISSETFTSLYDNDGDNEDWIELYNAGGSSVNLNGYQITDTTLAVNSWVLPNITIGAGEYLTIFASGKDRVDYIDHWESIVKEDDTWQYMIPTSEPASDWTDIGFNDGSWNSGPGGIGMGDGDDNTVVPGGTESVYMRRTFNVVDSAEIQEIIFHMDYDDGFVAYLNGVEIARENISGNPPAFDDFADGNDEAVLYSGGNPAEYTIDKNVWKPLIVNGNNVLAIQVHNVSSASTDLSARPWLQVGVSTAIVNYSTIPAWFTPPTGTYYLHTNFKISNNGETISLYDASSSLVDQVGLPELHDDITYGRLPNGTGGFAFLDPATPTASNATSTSYMGIWEDTLTFSLPAGFYTSAQTTGCTCGSGLSTVKYTTDGSKPTATSTNYSGSIGIPDTRVIRAGCFRSGYITKKSKIETNSYFIVDNHDLPVISISTHPDNFFDYDIGIYELGPNGEASFPHFDANFWQDWEREIHIEYFNDSDVQGFEQDCGVKIFGGWSRGFPMKSLRLIPRDQYGKDHFDFVFKDKPNIQEHDQMVLRNSGNDFNYTQFRDGLNHRMQMGNDNMDAMAYEPAVLYINGEYWGIHNMRERVNPEYVEANHGVDHKDVNFLEFDGDVKQGSGDGFTALLDFVENNDMTNSANYDQVKDMLDIENFVDYFAVETYHQNGDWPHNNIRYWSSPETGNKWRYIYFDTDFGLNMWGGYPASDDELDRVVNATDNVHSPMLKKLLTNDDFKCYFAERYADLINTTFDPDNYKDSADAIAAVISSEISNHHDRWTDWPGAAQWPGNVDHIKDYMDDRPAYARDDIEGQLSGVSGQYTITVDVSPAGAGVVKISTVIPDTYPWSGVYFGGCPVEVTAYPNEGYEFSNWSASGVSLSTGSVSNDITFTQNASLTANFNSTSNIGQITFNEINYNSSDAYDAGDWVELYNHGNGTVDLSGWVFKDGNDFNEFIIPSGTVLNPDEYLVIFRNDSMFTANHPSVANKVGPFNFKLSNGGERLRLYNSIGVLKSDVTYDDVAPWPTGADGMGFTLELDDPAGNLNDPANWFVGCVGGSPGGPYVQCPCSPVDLGADDYLCISGGSITLNSGLTGPHTNRSFQWYREGSPVGTSSTLNVILSGTYSLQVDSLGCVQTDEVEIYDNFTVNLGPDAELCSPATYTFATGLTNPALNFTWYEDAVLMGGETSPQLTVTTPATYSVTVSGGSCPNSTDEAIVTSAAAVPTHDTICEPGGVFNLSVTGPSNYDWYDAPTGGSLIHSGDNYTTPNHTATTTYYVEDADFFNGTVGPATTTEPGGDVWTNDDFDNAGYKLKFNVLQDLVLDAVWVDADGPQDVTITVSSGPDAGSLTPLHTRTVSITSGGWQRIPLGFELTPASGLWIDAEGSTGELAMSGNTGTAWGPSNPYEAPGFIEIYRTEPDWADNQGWFFYLYNWEFSSGPGPCDRVPVVAFVENCSTVAADFTADNTAICEGSTVTFTDNSTDATSWNWDFGAGSFPSTATGAGPHTVTYFTAGTKNVQLTVSDGVDNDVMLKPSYITVDAAPTTASAGIDQTICASSIVLPGNTPSVGSGEWTLEGGSGNFVNANNANTTVNTLGVGANTFRWTISNGVCTPSTDEITITREEAPSAAFAGADETVCGSGTTLNASAATSGTGTWSVVTGNGTFGNSNDPATTVSGMTAGSNIYRWTVSTGGVCPDETDEVEITSTTSVTTASAGANQSVCESDLVNLAANAPGAGETGTWTIVSGAGILSVDDPSSESSAVTISGAGTAVLEWEISNGVCTPSTDQVTINIDASPSVAFAGNDQAICADNTTLSATSPSVGTLTWTLVSGGGTFTNSNDPSTTITGLNQGDNVLRVNISNGACPDETDDVTITRDANPSTAVAGGDETVCSSGTNLSATTPTTGSGSWIVISGGATIVSPTDPGSSVTNLGIGDNVFRWEVTNGSCPSSTDEVTITRDENPSVANAGGDQSVCSTSGSLSGSIPTVGTVNWNVISGSAAVTNPSDPSSSVTGLSLGDNVFEIVISNGVCSTSTDQVTITRDANPTTATAGADQSICSDNTILTGNNPAIGSGVWTQVSGTSVTISDNTNPNSAVTAIPVGVVTLRWTVTNGTCAASSDDITITRTAAAPASVSLTPAGAQICEGENQVYTALPVNGGTTPTYEWFVNSVSQGAASTTNTFNLVSPSDGTQIYVVMNSSLGCASGSPATSTTETITVDQAPSIANAGNDQTICGSSTNLTATSPSVGTGIWSVISGPVTISDPNDPVSAASGINPGTVTLRWTVSNGSCPDETDDVNITSSTSQVVSSSITASKNPICAGETITFTSTNSNEGTSPDYQWLVDGSDVGNNSDSYVTNALTDGQTVQLVLTSSSACVTANPANSNVITIGVDDPDNITAISGNSTIPCNTSGEVYSVPATSGSIYNWNVPSFMTINTGQGSDQIITSSSSQTGAGNITVQQTTASGCVGSTVSLTVTSDCVNGLGDQIEVDIRIYPNPFSDEAVLLAESSVSGTYEYTVYDMRGVVMERGSGETGVGQKIGRDLMSGVYQIVLISKETVFVEKFIKEK